MSAPVPSDPFADFESLSHITAHTIGEALADFPLAMSLDNVWLASACRRVFVVTVMGGVEETSPSVQVVRGEIDGLRDDLRRISAKLASRSDHAESVLRRFAYLSPIRGQEAGLPAAGRSYKDWRTDGSEFLESFCGRWKEFIEATRALNYLENYLSEASAELCARNDPPRWKDAARRRDTVSLATWLSAVFEKAYNKAATVNNWERPSGEIVGGAWPDFFDRVARVMLKLDRIPDLQRVLKEARRQVKKGVSLPSTFLD